MLRPKSELCENAVYSAVCIIHVCVIAKDGGSVGLRVAPVFRSEIIRRGDFGTRTGTSALTSAVIETYNLSIEKLCTKVGQNDEQR